MAFASPGIVVPAGEGRQPGRIADDDSGSRTRDDSTLLELAAGVRADNELKRNRYVLIFTAGISMWNMGAGYVAGLALWHAFDRGWLKP
jgi:hypothetical protein